MIFLFCLWFGGWFAFARFADGKIGELITQLEQSRISVGCNNRTIIGFPFRIGVQCDDTRLAVNSNEEVFSAGQFKTLAQLYAPGKMIAELESPFTVPIGSENAVLNWQNMRLFADLNFSGGFEVVSLTTSSLLLQAVDSELAFKTGGIHLRPTPNENGSLDLAFDARELSLEAPGLAKMPKVDLITDAKLIDGYTNIILGKKPLPIMMADGFDVDLRSAIFDVGNDGRIAFSGPIKVNRDGTLSGKIRIGIQEPEQVRDWSLKVHPELAQIVGGLAQAVNTLGQLSKFGTQEMRSVTVTLNQGEMRMGIVSLGKLAPIY